MKKIAVVILNWNGTHLLREFLPSVLQFSKEATIYVIDNASTDTSISLLEEEFPSVKIISNKENFGFARGYNEGLQFIDEDIYCLINSDVQVTPNWLDPILHLFEKDSQIAIVQPKILDYKNKSFFEYAGAGGGFIDRLGYPFCRGRIFETIEKDNGKYDDVIPIFWASGACFFIRKDVYRELKGFDSDFFAHQEEIDLCWRSFNAGYSTYYCGYSTVYHLGGGTLHSLNPKKTYLNFRNSLLMLLKNLPILHLIPVLMIRLLLDGVAGIRFLIQKKPNHFWAVLQSHFGFYKLFFKTLAKRTSKNKTNYYKKSSIVFHYYIKKGKVFD